MVKKIELSEKEWKKRLTPEQYKVMREKGTERAFCGELWDQKEEGTYACAACGLPLFSSETKYDSKTGWPSFFEPVNPEHIIYRDDVGFFSKRTEAVCASCGSHLGHVFNDGPQPSGKRFCINSICLKFIPKK